MKIVCEKTQNEITYTTECKVVEFCCKKMKQVFDKEYDRHYKDGSGSFSTAWKFDERDIKIPTRMHDDYDDKYIESYQRISYCPFCGAEIE